MTNIAIIYYSSTGTNYQLAQWAKEGASISSDVDVRLFQLNETAPQAAVDSNPVWATHHSETSHIPVVTPKDLEWADGVIFSIPTRFGAPASQYQAFIDTVGGLWAQGKLANKVVTAMSSAQNPHGGQETTIQRIYTSMYHWGAIIVTPGYLDDSIVKAGGNPYGTSATQGPDGKIVEDVADAARFQAKRLVEVAQVTQSLRK